MELKRTLDHVFIFLLIASAGLIIMMVFNTFDGYSAFGFSACGICWICGSKAMQRHGWNPCACSSASSRSILFCSTAATIASVFHPRYSLHCHFWCTFFSADEMVGLHEQIGARLSEVSGVGDGTFLQGFSWVLLYLPVMVVGLTLMVLVVLDLLKSLPKAMKRKSMWLGAIIAIAVASILLLEMGEAYIYNALNSRTRFLTVIEESAELVVICGFYRLMQTLYLGMIEPRM